jgi:hypothetical protein
MVQPAHAEVETVHVVGFTRNGNGLLYGGNSLGEALEISLDDGQIKQSKLISTPVNVTVHSVVEVAMEIVES